MKINDTSKTCDAPPPVSPLPRFHFFLRWAAKNSGLACCAWLGVNGNIGAGRLLAFVAWVFAVSLTISNLDKRSRQSLAKKGRQIPARLSHGLGIAMICYLVWNGWWWTAIAFMLIELMEGMIYFKPAPSESDS
jgi:hypothetical protein